MRSGAPMRENPFGASNAASPRQCKGSLKQKSRNKATAGKEETIREMTRRRNHQRKTIQWNEITFSPSLLQLHGPLTPPCTLPCIFMQDHIMLIAFVLTFSGYQTGFPLVSCSTTFPLNPLCTALLSTPKTYNSSPL